MAWSSVEARQAFAKEYTKRPEVAEKRRVYDRNSPAAKARRARYRQEHPEIIAAGAKARMKRLRKERPLNWSCQNMLNSARRRAKQKGIPCTLVRQDIADVYPSDGMCPVFRTLFDPHTSCAASLDEVERGLGYVPGNIAVISVRANKIKNDATLPELIALIEWWRARS